MTNYDEIVTALDLITINGAKTLRIENRYGIKGGNQANLIVIDTNSEYEAIRTQAPVLYSIRNGEIIVDAALLIYPPLQVGDKCQAPK